MEGDKQIQNKYGNFNSQSVLNLMSDSFKSNDALIGYKLYEFLFLFELTIFLLKVLLICIGIVHPLGEGSYFVRKFTLYLLFGIFQEIIKLYLLWMTFSYLIHLILNRVKVILPKK